GGGGLRPRGGGAAVGLAERRLQRVARLLELLARLLQVGARVGRRRGVAAEPLFGLPQRLLGLVESLRRLGLLGAGVRLVAEILRHGVGFGGHLAGALRGVGVLLLLASPRLVEVALRLLQLLAGLLAVALLRRLRRGLHVLRRPGDGGGGRVRRIGRALLRVELLRRLLGVLREPLGRFAVGLLLLALALLRALRDPLSDLLQVEALRGRGARRRAVELLLELLQLGIGLGPVLAGDLGRVQELRLQAVLLLQHGRRVVAAGGVLQRLGLLLQLLRGLLVAHAGEQLARPLRQLADLELALV